MEAGVLGKVYHAGDVIIRHGDIGDCMYVIQQGRVEALQEKEGKEIQLATLETGDVFGEMALFNKAPRSATIRAIDEVRVLTIDKKTFLQRIHEDPSLVFRILQKMSNRIREMDDELVRIKTNQN